MLLRLLKILGILVALLLAAVVLAGFVLNSKRGQNMLMRHATALLSERLHVPVVIDSIDVDFKTYDIRLYGIDIEDLQHRKMLQIERLSANVELWPLLERQVKVSSVSVTGVNVMLCKTVPDSAANYQFIIDAFKSEKNDSASIHGGADTVRTDSSVAKKAKLELDIRKVDLERIHVEYKDSKDYETGISRLVYRQKGQERKVSIDGLRFANDNHLPRKNAGKPHRGAFDPGHIDATANLELTISHLAADSIVAAVERLEAIDKGSGLHLKDLTFNLQANRKQASLSQMAIKLKETTLSIENATVQLPDKQLGTTLSYATSPITGQVLLRDIAKPFAPALSKFGIPLLLNVKLSGTDNGMQFDQIRVATADKKFGLAAKGRLTHLKDKYKMAIRFDVSSMKTDGLTAERIINQFPVKKFMMQQIEALGDITYHGDIAILWRREEFKGLLNTSVGALDFEFALDETNKYLTGRASTEDIDLGRAFSMKDFGPINCTADFRFDISKPRTAKMRKQKGGKLPIGTVSAYVVGCKYKKIRVRNLVADIVSDGAVAEGNITIKGRYTDLLCAFSFTSTDFVKNKIKVKPGIKFHGLSEDDKLAKEERKQQKKEQKQLMKEQKRQLKEQKRQQKKQEREMRKKEREQLL